MQMYGDNERERVDAVVNELLAKHAAFPREILKGRILVLEHCVELFHGGHATVTPDSDIVYHVVQGEGCDCGGWDKQEHCAHVFATLICHSLAQQGKEE